MAGAGVPSPSHCLGYLGFISDALRLLSSPCPLWGGEEVGWGGEGLPALPGPALPCTGYVAVEGGAGGRDKPSHHCTHHSGRNSVCLAEPAACLECCLPPQQPLPTSPSAGCVGCTRLGDEAGSLAQHPPSSHSRTRFACMLGGRGVPRGL